jgi:hypothetical protein
VDRKEILTHSHTHARNFKHAYVVLAVAKRDNIFRLYFHCMDIVQVVYEGGEGRAFIVARRDKFTTERKRLSESEALRGKVSKDVARCLKKGSLATTSRH